MRARAIARHMSLPVTLIGSTVSADGIRGVDALVLPMDTAPGMTVESFEALHYAPLGVDGLRERMGLLADWFRASWPCLLVVDVSVEVATLARLYGVPTIYLRMHGDRSDTPHRMAYTMATRLLAPYPAAMESLATPRELVAITDYAGWISRFSCHDHGPGEAGRVLIINGRGGTAFSRAGIEALAHACPEMRFRVAGELSDHTGGALHNVNYLGLLEDPMDEMCRAQIVIGSAGDSLVSECAALGRPFIAIAEDRPYSEQRVQVRRLNELGVAIGLEDWPDNKAWPAILKSAEALPREAWHALADPEAAALAARYIEKTAERVLPGVSVHSCINSKTEVSRQSTQG